MLKVGQKVRVRSDLDKFRKYGGIMFAESMEEFRNQEFTVDSITMTFEEVPCLMVDGWYFSKEMLIVLNQKPAKKMTLSTITNELQIFFNDKKRTVVIKDNCESLKKVTCAEEDVYSRRIGFLEAYFQLQSGLTKKDAHEFLDSLEEL